MRQLARRWDDEGLQLQHERKACITFWAVHYDVPERVYEYWSEEASMALTYSACRSRPFTHRRSVRVARNEDQTTDPVSVFFTPRRRCRAAA